MSKVVEDAFKRTGLAHLLVVSGYQVTLVYVALTLVFSQLLARSSWLCAKIKLKAWASGAAVLGALAFVAICGVESSSARAGIAAIFLACAHALERGGGLVQAVGVSALALMILDPGCFLSPGVQLTYAALIGICLGHRESDGPIIGFLRVCLTATVCSSVTVAIWFNQISIIGLVLNPLLGTPAALVSCNFGLAATILLLSGIDANGWILQHVVNLTAWFKQLILVCSDLPWAALALEGAGKFVVVSFLVCLVLAIFRSRLEEYLLDRGLYLG